MLTVRGLCKRFGQGPSARLLFSDLDLALAPGEFVAIIGESGSGKSTLLNLIAGLDVPDAGTIEVDGVKLDGMSDAQRSRLRRTEIGFVFQAFHLLPYLDVADNVALPLVIAGCPPAQRRERVLRALAEVGLADRAQAASRELSGGEMQRVAIARALVHEPRLLLADEPTGNLDEANARQVLGLLRERTQQRRTACILVTHSMLAARVAQRIVVLGIDGLRAVERA
jgi:putative ABC transport system ATP-binding protein